MGKKKRKMSNMMMVMVIGDVTMVTGLQGRRGGAYSTDIVIVILVHCPSSKRRAIVHSILLLIQMAVIGQWRESKEDFCHFLNHQ